MGLVVYRFLETQANSSSLSGAKQSRSQPPKGHSVQLRTSVTLFQRSEMSQHLDLHCLKLLTCHWEHVKLIIKWQLLFRSHHFLETIRTYIRWAATSNNCKYILQKTGLLYRESGRSPLLWAPPDNPKEQEKFGLHTPLFLYFNAIQQP